MMPDVRNAESHMERSPDSPIVILDNYDSFSYNLYQMVQAQTSRTVQVYRNDALGFEELLSLHPHQIILSPGPGHPGIDKDFGLCREVILNRSILNCAVLGVCLGHQGIAHHLGGQVISAPEIVHGKSSFIQILHQSPLFEGLTNPFEAMRYHSLLVEEINLPANLRITARTVEDHLPMALEAMDQPLYGIQFHPESIGTPEGHRILKNFLELC